MPAREDLRLTEAGADVYVVEDVRTVPPQRLGTVEHVYPNGFDDMPRWNSFGEGARFRPHGTPFSTIDAAFATFIGPDE